MRSGQHETSSTIVALLSNPSFIIFILPLATFSVSYTHARAHARLFIVERTIIDLKNSPDPCCNLRAV